MRCIVLKKNINWSPKHLVDVKIATLLGEAESILLNQILYWISKCGRELAGQEEKWIYNSLAEWHKQFSYWSMYKLRKTIKSLEDLGLIKSIKVNAKRWNHTKWYTVNHSDYNKLLKKLKNKDHNSESSPLNELNKINIVEKNVTNQNSKAICESKVKRSTNRFVENRQIIITKNNYTNSISSINEKQISQSNEEIIKEVLQEKKEIKKIAKEMKEIWDKIFSYSSNPIKSYLNDRIIKRLEKIKREKFNNDLEEWERYVKKINSSQFLMGEKETKNNFKAVFPWLIKEETIEAIEQGAYGIGDRELDINNLSENIENKKEEIVNKINRKITELTKNKINEKEERREFEEYVRNTDHREEDKYGILRIMQHIPYQSLLEREEYKGIRENLYESYIMKKYVKHTKLETRKKLRLKLNEAIKDKGKTKYEVLQEMKYLETKITAMNMENTSYKQIETMI